MEDYIEILLEELNNRRQDLLSGEYFIQSHKTLQAAKALHETLSEPQKELFLAFEAQSNRTAAISEAALARQAFLLAKEIYR